MADGHVMKDTSDRRVVRDGATVRRPTFPWTPAVHALLRHLESVDFPYAPRVLGVENDEEILTYLAGASGKDAWPSVVDERGLWAMGRMLRYYHQAVAEWKPEEDLIWAAGTMGTGEPGELICHGDFGPWNLVWDGIRPVGIIDWDFAHPASPRKDITYALEYVVPLRNDNEAIRNFGHPAKPNRRRRMAIFLQAYGLNSPDGLVDEILAGQRGSLETARMLADNGIEPQATWVREGRLAEIEARIAWLEESRHLFV